jgi:hypothetical protein
VAFIIRDSDCVSGHDLGDLRNRRQFFQTAFDEDAVGANHGDFFDAGLQQVLADFDD